MADELLPYYNEELSHIRNQAVEFAKEHPKIAKRLRIGSDAIEDPHVGRLIEAFAYLNARIRHKLDDDFPELSDAMLGVLYPHYQAPIPSMAIVQLNAAADLTAPYELAAGAELETDPIDGEPCRFRTCYPVTLWPIQVKSAHLSGFSLTAPTIAELSEVASVLKLEIGCVSAELTLAELRPETLRFYLRGQGQYLYALYQLLFNDLIRVAVKAPDATAAPTLLSAQALTPVGFDPDQGMLPYPPQAFVGYRLLTEYFVFPQKFLFFEIKGLTKALADMGNRAELYFYFRTNPAGLEQKLSAQTFALGCTPMVNLFEKKRVEPIMLDQLQSEYRVVPDARHAKAAEIYSIDRVVATGPEGAKADYVPFFGVTHGNTADEQRRFWKASRRPAPPTNPGSEVYLSVVDLDLDPSAPSDWTLHVRATCFNRDLPNKLPFGGGEPRLRLSAGAAAIDRIECLTAPTSTLRPPLGRGGLWRLISHLNLNHLSITGAEQGAEVLREILKLYDFRDSPETRAMIDGVLRVDSRPDTARIPGQIGGGLAHGVEVTIEFDEKRFSGSGVFLFAAVLERFLTLYCSINSFTRLVAKLRGREGVLRKWQPRVGDKTLL
ncbi:MAG: type VI secretion system baseplate subunit TssF [Chromatiales bacterium]|jgi:type VI secretion system protein ImpG